MGSESTFIQIIKSPLRFKVFLLKNLPMALLAGLRLKSVKEQSAAVSLSLNYFTKNPFRSIYFACLAMAAELSTGILAMKAVDESHRKFSFLVLEMQATFMKKATGTVTFRCSEGQQMVRAVQECVHGKESKKVTVQSLGINQKGETVAEFQFTWSFKLKEMGE